MTVPVPTFVVTEGPPKLVTVGGQPFLTSTLVLARSTFVVPAVVSPSRPETALPEGFITETGFLPGEKKT